MADAFDVVILAGGAALPPSLLEDLARAIDDAAVTIAADGGLAHAERAGRDVDTIVGDLDSVAPHELAAARERGVEVLEHPHDKDATDLDLALALAAQRWPGPSTPRVLVVGGHGGRLDHLLANVLLLAADRHAGLVLTGWLGTAVVQVVRETVALTGAPGSVVSLLALHGPATGVTTTGLRFALDDATLAAGSSLGVSNVLVADRAQVRVGGGVLVTIQPGNP